MAETLFVVSLLAVFVLLGLLLYNLIRRTGRAWKIGVYLLAAAVLATGAASAIPGTSLPAGQNPVATAPANTGAPSATSTPGAGTGTATTTSPRSGTGTTTPASVDTETAATAMPPVLTISYIDVGQADSILVELPNGQNMLIDGGNRADSDTVVNCIRSRGMKRLDILIATHPHEDHIGGLPAVIQTFDIGQVYMPAVTTTTNAFADMVAAMQAKKLHAVAVTGGMVLSLAPMAAGQPTLSATFLAPNANSYEDLNDYSAVLRLVYGGTSFLFAGDAETVSEREMLAAGYNLRADVLKVGHHGSDSSTSPGFLQAVKPQYAVISVGRDNLYGHPAPSTIAALKAAGVQIYRTDYQGTIVATSDGQHIRFNHPAWTPATVATSPTGTTSGANTTTGTAGSAAVVIAAVDLKGEVVTITNQGSTTADLSGWLLLSVQGGQHFTFPAGVTLGPGQTLFVVSGKNPTPGPGRLIWPQGNVWNNEGDPAQLYDAKGNLVSSYPR